jgi:hypothetical protein
LSQTGNVNEMPLYFYVPCSYTVDNNRAKSMAIEAGYDTCVSHVGSSACGGKLHPCMILNCQTTTKEKLPKGIIIRYQPRGWKTIELMKNWYLVGSCVEHKAKETSENAGFGCI